MHDQKLSLSYSTYSFQMTIEGETTDSGQQNHLESLKSLEFNINLSVFLHLLVDTRCDSNALGNQSYSRYLEAIVRTEVEKP